MRWERRRLGARHVAAWGLVLSAGFVACGDGSDDLSSDERSGGGGVGTSVVAAEPAERCLVRLHGKGGSGSDTQTDGDVTVISPEGNGDGWGGRQWAYFPDEDYEDARAVVADAVEGCEQVIVNGFSNGGAFAAKLYCRGETFDGRLVGVVVDDPVPDAAVEGCAPSDEVVAALYWTGALEPPAVPGWECEEEDWTCEGGQTIGIDAFADALGVVAEPSPHEGHEWFVDAPELSMWR